MRRLTALVLLVALAGVAAACGTDDPSVRAEQRGKPVVITGLWPVAELAQVVGGDDVVVVNLTPVGESPHELTLTARPRREVASAGLAIVVGRGFQPVLERAAADRSGPTLDLLDELRLPDRPDGASGPADPHVWLDPTIMGSIATAIGAAIADLVPDHASAIRKRAQHQVEADVRLDAQLKQGLAGCRQRVIASQHEAFGWFAARYGFTNVGFDGPAPDADPAPDPAHVAAITPHLDDGTITTLFLETLSPTSWVEVIADEHGLDTEVLDPYEGLTPAEEADRLTYREAMLDDLKALQDQLDCEAG
jgi:zinc transport system substrate-binding protein